MVYNYLSYLILFRKKNSLNELLFIFHTVSVWTEAGNRPSFLDTQDYCKSAIKILIRQDFCYTFSFNLLVWLKRYVLPFCPRPGKTKNPDSTWESGFYCLLLFFKVVPPEDFTVFCFSSKWCHQESNRGHKDFQSFALPTELLHIMNQ